MDTKFTPTANHLAALSAFQYRHYACTIEQGMSGAGFTRQTWYDWHKDIEGFSDWWAGEANAFFRRELPRVMGALLRQATSKTERGVKHGDAVAARTLLERYDQGFAPRRRTDARVQGSLDLSLAEMSDDELERLEAALRDEKQETGDNGDGSSTL